MFGLHLPGFLNPLTPFKQAFAVASTLVDNAKTVASAPLDVAKHQVGFAQDVLSLDFKGAVGHQVAIVTKPAAVAKDLAGNEAGLLKKLIGNWF